MKIPCDYINELSNGDVIESKCIYNDEDGTIDYEELNIPNDVHVERAFIRHFNGTEQLICDECGEHVMTLVIGDLADLGYGEHWECPFCD